MFATFKKLKDGSWGARVPAGMSVSPGATVTIKKADGSTKTETVGKILFTCDDGAKICTIAVAPKSSGGSYSRGYGYSRSRGCKTGGNCSSFGSGRSCGAHNCDGY